MASKSSSQLGAPHLVVSEHSLMKMQVWEHYLYFLLSCILSILLNKLLFGLNDLHILFSYVAFNLFYNNIYITGGFQIGLKLFKI